MTIEQLNSSTETSIEGKKLQDLKTEISQNIPEWLDETETAGLKKELQLLKQKRIDSYSGKIYTWLNGENIRIFKLDWKIGLETRNASKNGWNRWIWEQNRPVADEINNYKWWATHIQLRIDPTTDKITWTISQENEEEVNLSRTRAFNTNDRYDMLWLYNNLNWVINKK